MNKQLLAIIKKECLHIVNDAQTLFVIIVMPLLMIFLYGNAITLEMRNIATLVQDKSSTPQSRDFLHRIASSGFFNVRYVHIHEQQIDALFRRRDARCLIIIPQNFATSLQSQETTAIQLIIDASDPNAAKLISSYMSSIVNAYNNEHNTLLKPAFVTQPRFMYNPDQKSSSFFVPGLIAIILLMISAMLTSIAIVREKERGTLEQILVSPIKPVQIIFGKIFPYLLLGLVDGLIILLAGIYGFKVPMCGSYLLLIGMMLLYILTGLSMGILISTIARTQQVAMLMSLMITMLPTLLLSGFMFPIESMPYFFRVISRIVPATHFIQIIRGIMLKGIGAAELVRQISFLGCLSAFLMLVSVKKFKADLEN